MGIFSLNNQKELIEELKDLGKGDYTAYFEDEYGFSWSMYLKGVSLVGVEDELVQLNIVPCDEFGREATLEEVIETIEDSTSRGYKNSYYLALPDVKIDEDDEAFRYYHSGVLFIDSYDLSDGGKYIKFKLKIGYYSEN